MQLTAEEEQALRLAAYGFRPLPIEFAALVVHRTVSHSTAFADYVLQSNIEARRYPPRRPARALEIAYVSR